METFQITCRRACERTAPYPDFPWIAALSSRSRSSVKYQSQGMANRSTTTPATNKGSRYHPNVRSSCRRTISVCVAVIPPIRFFRSPASITSRVPSRCPTSNFSPWVGSKAADFHRTSGSQILRSCSFLRALIRLESLMPDSPYSQSGGKGGAGDLARSSTDSDVGCF
jgi:hypothetical protein